MRITKELTLYYMKQKTFNLFTVLTLISLSVSITVLGKEVFVPKNYNVIIVNTPESFYNKTPEEGLKEALKHYNIKHPNIVHAQAILETGNFTSKLCKEHNNLFGLYNSKEKSYFKFNHWTESVIAYKAMIQYKYKGNDYYTFLKDINYAEDKSYITKLKEIVRRNM